jgi:hypothetical protein
MTLNGSGRVDHFELLPIRRDGKIVALDDTDDRERGAGGLPALGAAAGMIEGNVTLNADGHRVLSTFAGERAAGEIRRALLDALINGRMN